MNAAQAELSGAHRTFYQLPRTRPFDADTQLHPSSYTDDEVKEVERCDAQLLKYIYEQVVGCDTTFKGPFGVRRIVYCDYTASGRALRCIEDYIESEVLPEYGNTHTTSSVTSLQTTLLCHEARDIVRNAVRASDHDAVIFVRSGCTGAIHKLIHCLDLEESPIIVCGPHEHHSNLLPWRHLAAAMTKSGDSQLLYRVAARVDSSVDLEHLEQILSHIHKVKKEAALPRIIGVFSAASNVSGVLTNTHAVTAMLHKYGALAFWDYATAAPYVPLEMNPRVPGRVDLEKDAIYFSMHKFIGGVQAPGVLVVKRKLIRSTIPDAVGGGSVFFVRRENQLYLRDEELREEGGTPSIVGVIRAGLVFKLQRSLRPAAIMQHELEIAREAFAYWLTCPGLLILGGNSATRLPIFSFLIRAPFINKSTAQPLFLHHNFVTALLNDLLGIQSRGGCACAAPYAMDLLGLTEHTAAQFEELLVGSGLDRFVLSKYFQLPHREILRPGFTRINLPYFMPAEERLFVMRGVAFVAQHGWRFLPQYKMNPETGEWSRHGHDYFLNRKWLGHVTFVGGEMSWRRSSHLDTAAPPPTDWEAVLEQAHLAAKDALRDCQVDFDNLSAFDFERTQLRWFIVPSEAKELLLREDGTTLSTSMVSIPAAQENAAPILPGRILSVFEADFDGAARLASVLCQGATCRAARAAGRTLNCDCLCDRVQSLAIDSDPAAAAAAADLHPKDLDPIVSKSQLVALSCPLRPRETTLNCFLEPTPSVQQSVSNRSTRHFTFEKPADMSKKAWKKALRHNESQMQIKPSTLHMKNQQQLWHVMPKEIYKPFLDAMIEHDMVVDGDRVMVCLSGGKDSLSLLHAMHQYQIYAHRFRGVRFELGAATVDPETDAYDPSPLKPYLAALGVPYFYLTQAVLAQAQALPYECASICSFCSRMKRGILYSAARRYGYNVLAMGQHLDDLAESFLMSIFHNGNLRTIKANYTVRDGDLRVIRPLVYVREKATREFADTMHLPVIPENCPGCFEAPKERYRIKSLLAEQECMFPKLYWSLLTAMRPLLAINITDCSAKSLLALGNTGHRDLKPQTQKVNEENDTTG